MRNQNTPLKGGEDENHMTELTYKPALELSQMIADKQLSAAELMRATLDRIDAANDVNAIVSLRDADALMTEAKAADGAERKGWLHGIPLAVKDPLRRADGRD